MLEILWTRRKRISAIEDSTIAVTVITYEEQVRGRLNLVSQAKTLDDRVRAYRGVQQISMDYRSITVISFDYAAAFEDQCLRKVYPRLGKMDLKSDTHPLWDDLTINL
jgi:tRNA(fMet)-specific endonuclease VapC